MLRLLRLPPWRRAPWRILRWPSLLFGIFVAALVLGVSVGSRPMFVSSAASGALSSDLEEGCRYAVGLRIERGVLTHPGPIASDLVTATAALDEALRSRAGDVDGVVTLIGDTARVATEGGAEGIDRVQLIARSGFEDHVEVVERGPEPGVWLPDTVAESLGVRAGDGVGLDLGAGPVPVPVGGVFRDLGRERDAFWCSLENRFLDEAQGRQPPPVALLDADDLVRVLDESAIDHTRAIWEHAPGGESWTFDHASDVIADLDVVAEASNNTATELGATLGPGRSSSDLAGTIDHARRTTAGVEGAAGPVALGTAGVAVLVLLTAGRSWLDRRRQEVTVLAMRGAGPASIAVKAVLEMSVPVVAGAAAGLALAVVLVRSVGPSTLIDPAAVTTAVRQVGLVVGLAVVVVAAVVGSAVRRIGLTSGGAASRATLLWWEPPVLALAAAALYELRSNGPARGEYEVDALLLVFPVLLLAGGAGLGARVTLTPRVSGWLATHLPTAGWLAVRRLIAGRLRAAAIVTGTAVAIGIVCFASSMSESLRTTTEAKVLLGPGAPQIIRLSGSGALPEGVGSDGTSTLVTRTSELGVVRRGHPSSDVLGVDPATFADAAFWDSSFAGSSLAALLDAIDENAAPDAPVPAIAVGKGLPPTFTLTLDGTDEPVEVEVVTVERADAFPGLGFRTSRPLVVVHREELARRGVDGLEEVWVADTSSAIADRLTEAGRPPIFVSNAAVGSVGARLQAQLWAVDYLEIVGPAAGVVTLAGLALYLAATSTPRRIGTAMARRMGARRRTRVVATTLEIAAMTVAGWVLGVSLSWVAARLVFADLDPLPRAAPAAIFRFGGGTVAATAAVAVGAALLVTLLVEGRSDRASLPELLRGGR